MIKTKSIYKPKEYGDGLRVLITRYYPRGVKKTHFDRWMRDLAPSQELLRRYKNEQIHWEDFIPSFKLELQENQNSINLIKSLKAKSNYSHVTLLCYEPEGTPCHRHLLKEIIKNPNLLNVDFVPEYADYHKGGAMKKHVAHKEACIVS